MKIVGPLLSESSTHARLSVRIESERLRSKELWFEVPIEYRELLCTETADGFLVGMLFAAMQYGEDIYVDGCVSEKLLFNLNNYAIPLLIAFSPSCRSIEITADRTSSAQFNGPGVGSGFSGGVDSFSTIYDRFELETSSAHRINCLLFFNVGSHGPWLSDDAAVRAKNNFTERYRWLKRYPDEIGLNHVPVDSNLHAFHPWGHQKTHTLTSAAATLVLQRHFSKYYYASTGVDYKEIFSFADKYKERDIGAYCETSLLPLLSTESIELIADGYRYTRAQKVLRISEYEPAKRYLNVCTSPIAGWKNCSTCPKCCRTQMALRSIGKLNEFSGVFDPARYSNVEPSYVRRQIRRARYDPFAHQNVELARERGVALPGYLSSVVISASDDFLRATLKKVLPKAALEYYRARRENPA